MGRTRRLAISVRAGLRCVSRALSVPRRLRRRQRPVPHCPGSHGRFSLARGWIDDPDRCRTAGIPDQVGFATKPTLAMLAHAVLVVAANTERTRHPSPSGLTPLTCNEVQHLLATLLARPAGDLAHRLRWSLWRRRHQARARTCHYQRQANQP